MRFNSYEFIFIFLPVTWMIWRTMVSVGWRRGAVGWLCLASLVYYGYWNWRYIPLLLLSLVINYTLGEALGRVGAKASRALLGAGLIWNLGLLAYFKYWNFFLTNVNAVTGAHWTLANVILPLGISFFTFQKIAYLVDAKRGLIRDTRFLDFALFVLFFPQLIAGPIVHHGEFIPQLRDESTWRFDARKTLLGGALFAFGLFQKSVIADSLAPFADSAFGLAANEAHLRLFEAWSGLAAYSLQLFNDFSGYSHMALGLALLFGFRLPVNFLAPYTAHSIIEFWHRWHISLSTFLREYVYFPLGGSRRGFPRQLLNLFVTMTLAGLWHGAGWTFILWGAVHGLALCINHLWRRRRGAQPGSTKEEMKTSAWWTHPITWFMVAAGWTLFRAPDLTAARLLGESLIGYHGISVPVAWAPWVQFLAPAVRPRGLFPNIGVAPSTLAILLFAAATAVWGPRLLAWLGVTITDVTPTARRIANELAPSYQVFDYKRVAIASVLFALGVAGLTQSSPFLYFQF